MDELNLQGAPGQGAPMGGAQMPSGGQGAPMSSGLTQEQKRDNLKGLMGKVDGEMQKMNAQKAMGNNQIEEAKGESLRQLFDVLTEAGVDPSNPEEVKAYLAEMKTKNPEIAMKIEALLAEILGDEQEAPMEGGGGLPPMPGQGMGQGMGGEGMGQGMGQGMGGEGMGQGMGQGMGGEGMGQGMGQGMGGEGMGQGMGQGMGGGMGQGMGGGSGGGLPPRPGQNMNMQNNETPQENI